MINVNILCRFNSFILIYRVRVYGPGVERDGNIVGAPANFTVETFSAGKGLNFHNLGEKSKTNFRFNPGNVDIVVLNPRGVPEKFDCRFNNDKNFTYSVSYIPKEEGLHKVYVKFNGRDVPKSPFDVQVEGHAGNAEHVTASGPGLKLDGVVVKKPTYFDVKLQILLIKFYL